MMHVIAYGADFIHNQDTTENKSYALHKSFKH